MSDKLNCRRCRKVSELKELKKIQKNDCVVLACPYCNCRNFNNVFLEK